MIHDTIHPHPSAHAAGLTVREVARRYRVGEDKVRGWIHRGELPAINTADHRCGKPRYVITPEALERFERSRTVTTPPKVARHRKQTGLVDYFPD